MNTLDIPDFMPILSGGPHKDPRDGACVMEMVSFLAGEEWSDTPLCTHPVLARMAQVVNDSLSDVDRQQLVPLIPRLFGTAPTGTDLERRVLSVRLAVWCAKQVIGHAGDAEKAAPAAILAAEQWADNLSDDAAANAADAANAANAAACAAAKAATCAAYAAKAATCAAYAAKAAAFVAYAAKAATCAAYAAKAATCAAYAAKAAAFVELLTGLIDEYDRLTGRDQYAPVDFTALACNYQALISA